MSMLRKLWPGRETNRQRFEALVRPHLDRLYRLAYRLTGNRDNAEDLVQDMVLKLYSRLSELEAIEQPAAWLSRILYRQFVDQYRKSRRSPVIEIEDEHELMETFDSGSLTPDETVNSEQSLKLLDGMLKQLNEGQREIVMLHDVEGYSLNEISEMTNVPVGTLKSRHNRARAKLRELIHKMEPGAQLGRVYRKAG